MQDILDAAVAYSDRWYSFWQIIGAIATVAAVGVALLLGRRDARLRTRAQQDELSRLEAERDEAMRRQHSAETAEATRAREAQARKIAFWTVSHEDIVGGERKTRYTVFCHNYSDAIVFDLKVYPAVSPRTGSAIKTSLDPGDRFSSFFWGPEGGGMEHAMTFSDLQRRHWRLHEDGRLELVGPVSVSTLEASA